MKVASSNVSRYGNGLIATEDIKKGEIVCQTSQHVRIINLRTRSHEFKGRTVEDRIVSIKQHLLHSNLPEDMCIYVDNRYAVLEDQAG